jgi:hypothetical protein
MNNPKQKFCQECVWFKSCTVRSRKTLLKIHKELDVSELLANHSLETKPNCSNDVVRKSAGRIKVKRFEVSDDAQSLMQMMPNKAAKVVEQLERKGIDLKVELRSRLNPFLIHKPKFMETPCRLLIQGGFNRTTLTYHLHKDNPKWTKETQRSHEAIIMAVLNHLDIVKEDRMFFRIK